MSSTIFFNNKPSICQTFTVAGPKESEGSVGKFFDIKLNDDKYGEDSFEKAEKKMLKTCIENLIKKSKLKQSDVDLLISGDLLNQLISSSFTAREFDISFFGIYNACATFVEGLILGAEFIDGNKFNNVICSSVSHFSTAERQYRYPLELGSVRPPQAQWTVTGAGASLINKHIDGCPSITCATIGKVVDFGVTDANNMGVAMAPSCAKVLLEHFKDTGRSVDYYDLIVTGDLGALGSRILKELTWEKGYDIQKNHVDCGELIYNISESDYQGGSGAGCSAIVFNSYIMDRLKSKKLNKVLLIATGALLSTVSSQQGESIPGISHLIAIENV